LTTQLSRASASIFYFFIFLFIQVMFCSWFTSSCGSIHAEGRGGPSYVHHGTSVYFATGLRRQRWRTPHRDAGVGVGGVWGSWEWRCIIYSCCRVKVDAFVYVFFTFTFCRYCSRSLSVPYTICISILYINHFEDLELVTQTRQ